jgi:hypothetical protein
MWSIGGSPTLSRVTFSGNTASTEAAASTISSVSSSFTNVTFSGNSADRGGGMLTNGGSATLTNVTFSGNTATSGGAMHNSRGSQTTVANSILWGDAGGEVVNVLNGRPGHQTHATFSYSDIEGSGGSGDAWDAALGTDGGGNIDAEPLMGTLGRYPASAATQTLPLLPGSPAIDTAASSTCPGVDQRGIGRPQNSGCDMGAFEQQRATIWGQVGQPRPERDGGATSSPARCWCGCGGPDPVVGGRITFTVAGRPGPAPSSPVPRPPSARTGSRA